MALAELGHAQNDRIRVNKESLETVVQQCQLALQQLACGCDDDDDDVVAGELDAAQASADHSASSSCNTDTAEFYGLLKSRFECADFKKKLENAQASHPQNMADSAGLLCKLRETNRTCTSADKLLKITLPLTNRIITVIRAFNVPCDAVEGSSWDMVSQKDLWGGGTDELETEDYVLVRQEDIIEGIATFMASYLVSHEQTKGLTPNQLQRALSKSFSTKKKGKLRKAWEGSKVIYNVASWGATAIGLYQNPALFCAASVAFRTSSRIISKLF